MRKFTHRRTLYFAVRTMNVIGMLTSMVECSHWKELSSNMYILPIQETCLLKWQPGMRPHLVWCQTHSLSLASNYYTCRVLYTLVTKIGLQDLVPMSLLCGNLSTLYDVDNPDWVPSVNMGYGTRNKSRLRHRREAAAATSVSTAISSQL